MRFLLTLFVPIVLHNGYLATYSACTGRGGEPWGMNDGWRMQKCRNRCAPHACLVLHALYIGLILAGINVFATFVPVILN